MPIPSTPPAAATALSTPTTFATTTSAAWTLPIFTPPAECINATNIWYKTTDCYSGTAQGFYRTTQTCTYLQFGDQNCEPNWRHPATECPKGFTPVKTANYDPYETAITRKIYCCPTAYDFKRRHPTLKDQSGDSATPYDKFCVASTLGSSGSSPLTLTAFDVSSASSMATYATISKTIEFDPQTDVLLAPVVTISFIIKPDGSTCVPDCQDPYTGGPWPRPARTVTSTPMPPAVDDSGLKGWATFIWVSIALGCAGFLGILACIGCCIHRRKKRKNMGPGPVR